MKGGPMFTTFELLDVALHVVVVLYVAFELYKTWNHHPPDED